MDATRSSEATARTPSRTTKDYKSRPGALVWFFRKSRDLWKNKHQALKASLKQLKNRVADLTKSRDQWRLKAEQANDQLDALKAQVVNLQAMVEALTSEKKNDQGSAPLRCDAIEQQRPCGQQYSVGVVQRYVSLVLDVGASLRCAAGALNLLNPPSSPEENSPVWTTGRLWLLRVGLAALLRPKVIAEDWVWMVDHSIQIGQCKCLVILGIRLSDCSIGRPLCHQDMELIDLVPMKKATKQTVAVCLEDAVAKTGVPRAILSDQGADLHGATEMFRQEHPETDEFYDIKHKAACLLKARLEKDPRWKEFATLSGQTKFATQQTQLACLVPPSQRTKARFMNLGELVKWGRQTLALLDDPSPLLALELSVEQVHSKLGWLREFREGLAEWSADQDVIEGVLDFVRCRGFYRGAGQDLTAVVPIPRGDAAKTLRQQLIAFVAAESSKARIGEVLPGTTEVLESSFGKLKALEDGQSKSGFTGLVLSLGAMVSTRTAETIHDALERCRVRDVMKWCAEKLGVSVQSQRRQAYGELKCATNLG